MFSTAVTLIVLGFLCLAGAIVSLIFTIMFFAGNKPGKFGWLSGMLASLAGMVICIFIFVRKAVHKMEEVSSNMITQYTETATETLNASGEDMRSYLLKDNVQTALLRSYANDTTINKQFYTYFGFRDYYRFPLRYPYAIHCIDLRDNGSLFNEKEVSRFNESDNGDADLNIPGIKKLAFDQKLLLLEQQNETTGSNTIGPKPEYILFEFDTEQVSRHPDTKTLFREAKAKGYQGPDSLMTIEQYNALF